MVTKTQKAVETLHQQRTRLEIEKGCLEKQREITTSHIIRLEREMDEIAHAIAIVCKAHDKLIEKNPYVNNNDLDMSKLTTNPDLKK